MISRRELLRRMSLSVAGAAIPAGLVAKEIIRPVLGAGSIKPDAEIVSQPINADSVRLTVNGVEVGAVANVSVQSHRQTIDVTSLDSIPQIYAVPDTSTVDVQVVPLFGSDSLISDTFFSGEMVRVKIDMQGMAYEFDSYILKYRITSDINTSMMVDFSMEVVGEILIS